MSDYSILFILGMYFLTIVAFVAVGYIYDTVYRPRIERQQLEDDLRLIQEVIKNTQAKVDLLDTAVTDIERVLEMRVK